MCQLSTRENGLNNTQRKKMFEYPKMRRMFWWSTEEKDVPVCYLQRRKFRRSIHGKKIFDRNFFYPQYPQEFFFALTIFASFCSNPNYRAARSSLQKKCYIIFILCKNLLKLKQCGPWLALEWLTIQVLKWMLLLKKFCKITGPEKQGFQYMLLGPKKDEKKHLLTIMLVLIN